MPNLVINIVGDARSYERALRRSERASQTFGRRMARNFGRAGVAAGAALGTALVVELKRSTDAAMEAEKVLGQTQVAVRNAGASWAQYGDVIQDATTRLSRLAAVNDEELLQSFSILVRATGDVSEALRLNALAADVARGRGIDLAAAATLVAKVNAGNIGLLRRQGFEIDKNATATEGLALLQQKYAGAAEQYGKSAAGAQDRFRIAIEELEEKLGDVLLPTVTNYLEKATKWLENTENQEKLVGLLEGTVKVWGETAATAAESVDKLADATGRLKKAVEDMDGGDYSLRDLVQDISDLTGREMGGPLPTLEPWKGWGPGRSRDAIEAIRRARVLHMPEGGIAGEATAGQRRRPLTTAEIRRRNEETLRRNRWFDAQINRMLSRVQDISGLRGQIARLKEIAGLVQDRMKATKDVTRWLTLEDELLGIQREIHQKQAEKAEKAAQDAEDAKRKREEMYASVAEGLAKEFGGVQLGVPGGPLTVGQVKAAIAKADRRRFERRLDWAEFAAERAESTKTLKDDLKVQRMIERILKEQIGREGRTLELVKALWRTREKIREINKKGADKDPLAGLTQVSSRQLARILGAGVGLNAAGRRRLEANISGAQIQPIHVSVEIDGREVGRAVTRDQSRTSYRTTRQTSGHRG